MGRKHETSKKPRFSASEFRGLVLVIPGVVALVFYYSWWFQAGHLGSIWLLFAFVIALVYGLVQIVGSWLLYLATHRRYYRPLWRNQAKNLTVDVFVTACGESLPLVERALTAACNMRGEYKTWLLDDGDDPELARLAKRLGAGYLTRTGSKDAKAGNVNAALARTEGDIVAIFDIDHAPKPDFLQQTVGYFVNPDVGFVQVMLTFENKEDSWVAEAACESSLDFYNPTSIGSDGVWSTTLVGSNALIRREALDSAGGYQPGLAEDLATSIAIHAVGWVSVYVEEPLAPGLAPPDITAWFTQQLKWARGVFELLLTRYFSLLPELGHGQRLSYAVRMTYYWVGPFTALHILATLLALYLPGTKFISEYQRYIMHLAPLGVMTILIRQLALRRWMHKSIEKSGQVKPMALVFATWPIYTMAWMMALLRVPLKFKLTPKTAAGTLNPLWLLPQLLTTIALVVGAVVTFLASGFQYTFVLLTAAALVLPQILLLLQRLLSAGQMVKKQSAVFQDRLTTTTD